MSRLPKQDWVDEDAVASLNAPDPLRSIFSRSRARRGGEVNPPPTQNPIVSILTATTNNVPPVSSTSQNVDALQLVFEANAVLSGTGLKILIAALQRGQDETVSLSQFMQQTKLSKNTVIAGVRECLDWGWMIRRQVCSRCRTALPDTDGEKVSLCTVCGKHVSPQPHYTVQNPNTPVQYMNRGVEKMNSTPVLYLDRAVLNSDSPVQNLDSPPVQNVNRVVQNPNSPEEILNSIPVQNLDSPPVQNVNRYKDRIGSIIARNKVEDPKKLAYPVQNLDSPPVQNVNRSRARADSDSESNVTNESDSVYMQHNGNGNGKSETEQLAQASCKAIESGTSSLGMHIKAWAHARQLDARTGTKIHQTALQAIQHELTAQRRETGQVQGKAWTRRVYDYFDSQGQPLGSSRKDAK